MPCFRRHPETPAQARRYIFSGVQLSVCTADLGEHYAILPGDGHLQQRYKEAGTSGAVVPSGFAYNSGSNHEFLSLDQLRELIRLHVDPSFQPV